MESNVLKAVEEISGYTPDEMIAMYNDYGRMAKEWEAYASAGLSPEVCAEYRKFEDEVVASGMTFGEVVELMHKKQDGRLVVLPCKVGDTINAFRYSKEKGGLYILSDKVTSVAFNKSGYTVKTKSVFYPIKQKEGYDFAQISEYPDACADFYIGEHADAEKVLNPSNSTTLKSEAEKALRKWAQS